jgi:hypothetical protein
VLEEEFGEALTLNEDLQVQYETIGKVRCSRCVDSAASQSKLVGISSQIERQLEALGRQHRPQVIMEEEDVMSQEEEEKPQRGAGRGKGTRVSSGETSTTAGGQGMYTP